MPVGNGIKTSCINRCSLHEQILPESLSSIGSTGDKEKGKLVYSPQLMKITPELVLAAYAQGIFPMADSRRGEVGWYQPAVRGILPLDAIHVSRSLAQLIRSHRFEVTSDRDLPGVIDACADRNETWISQEIQKIYIELHQMGFAHSVETYLDGELVGGLYGIHIRGAFMAESMFHRVSNAGKISVAALSEHMRSRGFQLLDIQEVTPITKKFGGIEIPHETYLEKLKEALEVEIDWDPFTFSATP